MGNEYNKWIDPDQNSTGVLLSDMIEYYIKEANLIDCYDGACLKPASYALRLGKRFYRDGKLMDLLEGNILVIEPNSIVFVSMFEKINMPYYMVGRFNLKIDLIYQGLILGTGPQVDPGFSGHLSCPLHNISNNHIEIKYKERFATIDFIKTTKFACNEKPDELKKALNVEALYKKPINGFNGNECKLFPDEKKRRTLLDNYLPPGRRVMSSVKYLDEKVEKFQVEAKKEIDFRKKVEIISVGAMLAIILGLGAWVWRAFQQDYTYIKDLKSTISQLEQREYLLNGIEAKIDKINKDLITQEDNIEDVIMQIKQIKKTEIEQEERTQIKEEDATKSKR